MASWLELDTAAPELADRVWSRYAAHRHHVLATLRADGAPRLSGIEVHRFRDDVWLGMMPGSVKAADLRRDARFALHSAPLDTDLAEGDARLAGRAVEITDPETVAAFAGSLEHDVMPGAMDLFRLELDEVVLVTVIGDRLVMEAWDPVRGDRRRDRH